MNTNKNDAHYNALASMLSGKDIRDYLACGGTLEELDQVKEDWDNWADATAEFEAERREAATYKAESINLFTSHPY